MLGTPIPPTQSSQLYRTLAPSPPVQPTTYPIASHPDPSTIRSSIPSIPSVDYSYLAARFHRGGKVSQDDASKAWARAKQAAIQRDHRSRRRAGQTVSLTPTISQLGAIEDFEGPGEGILCYGPSSMFKLTMEGRWGSRRSTTAEWVFCWGWDEQGRG